MLSAQFRAVITPCEPARLPEPLVALGEKNTHLSYGTERTHIMSRKSKAQKKRLAKLDRQNSRIPAWVMLKTDREDQRNNKRRNWRRSNTDE